MDFRPASDWQSPFRFLETYPSRINQADWSPDGASLVAKLEAMGSGQALTIRTSDGRPIRNLSVDLSHFQRLRWAPDGSITVQGRDLKGRQWVPSGWSEHRPGHAAHYERLARQYPTSIMDSDGKSLVFRRNSEKGPRMILRRIRR